MRYDGSPRPPHALSVPWFPSPPTHEPGSIPHPTALSTLVKLQDLNAKPHPLALPLSPTHLLLLLAARPPVWVLIALVASPPSRSAVVLMRVVVVAGWPGGVVTPAEGSGGSMGTAQGLTGLLEGWGRRGGRSGGGDGAQDEIRGVESGAVGA